MDHHPLEFGGQQSSVLPPLPLLQPTEVSLLCWSAPGCNTSLFLNWGPSCPPSFSGGCQVTYTWNRFQHTKTSFYRIMPRLTGKELEGCEYETPFGGEQAHLLPGLHVTSTAGTGLVMTKIRAFRFVSTASGALVVGGVRDIYTIYISRR